MSKSASTKVLDRNLYKEKPRRYSPEAVAMRRIVVEMGFWLSPLLRDHPLPVLSDWERTVDLQKLQRWHENPDPVAARTGATGANVLSDVKLAKAKQQRAGRKRLSER